jgi:hypothetical protein
VQLKDGWNEGANVGVAKVGGANVGVANVAAQMSASQKFPAQMSIHRNKNRDRSLFPRMKFVKSKKND